MPAKPCEICDKIGDSLRVDYTEGEKLPPEASQLVDVAGTDGDIVECPLCHQHYAYDHRADNDAYGGGYDIYELKLITAENVTQTIAANKAAQEKHRHDKEQRVKRFARQVEKKYGTLMAALAPNEKRIVDYLTNKFIYGEYQTRLEEELGMDQAIIEPLLRNLEKQGIVRKKIYWPLSPDAHGFQQEMSGGDPRPYTKLSINSLNLRTIV